MSGPRPRHVDPRGRRFVVTGATSGLGRSVATALAERGAHLVLAVRSPERAAPLADDLGRRHPETRVEVVALDLADLATVRRAAREVEERLGAVDVLVNNAGLMAIDEQYTAQGVELTMAVNHLGHATLTTELLAALERGVAPRVVTVTSLVHHVGSLDPTTLAIPPRRYRRWSAYAASKLANLAFALELERRLRAQGRSTVSLAAHPGAVATHLGHEGTGWSNAMMRRAAPRVLPGPDYGARPILRAALDPGLAGGILVGPAGLVVGPPRTEWPSRAARDPRLGAALWAATTDLIEGAP